MNFSQKFDLVVVGGGPAGTVAARTAAELGVNTVLLEKDRDFGIPVRCGEGIGLEQLPEFIELSPKWIDNKLDKVRFYAPNGLQVPINLEEKGAIINRKVFDFELARLAAEAGAYIRNRCCVTGMIRENGGAQVKFEYHGREYRINAPLVIGADGVESRVARWSGVNTSIAPSNIETCFQYTLHHPDIDIEYCDFYFGNDIAPGGYIWVFPKGVKLANVGIGVAADRTKERSAKEYLDDFIQKRFPDASHLSSIAGAVPTSKPLKKMAVDNVMLVGDAAFQSDPISGGGIISAMWGGRYAGQTAALALEKGDFSAKSLSAYSRAWNKKVGDIHNRHYRLKKAVHRLTDDIFNRTADILLNLPREQRTMRKIFQTALVNEPSLVVDIVKAFIP